MNSYILRNKECIDFFMTNKGIDFETSVVLIVRLMKTIINNMKNPIDSQQNTEILTLISSNVKSLLDAKIENENKQKYMFQQYKEGVLQSVREIISTDNAQQIKNIHEMFKEKRIDTNEAILGQHVEQLLKGRDTILKERIDHVFKIHSEKQDKLLEKLNTRDQSMDRIDEYLRRQIGSNTKGKQGERTLELLLSRMYPNATISNTSGQTASGDFILKRNKHDPILIDTKDYDTLVPDREVEKFFRDIETQKMDGILLSQSSGIAQKNNYEFMLHGGNIALFVHTAEYDADKIRISVDMLEQIRKVLQLEKEMCGGSNGSAKNMLDESIPREILSCINQEYNVFISTRLHMMDQLKKQYQDNMVLVEKMQLPSLERYLEPKFANIKKGVYLCDVCDSFVGKNKKSLAAHRKKCILKSQPKQSDIVIDT